MANPGRGILATAVALLLAASTITIAHGQDSIGINYGRVANNLPPPNQVVSLLQSRGVKHTRIYDTDSDVLSAFANSGIDIGVTVPNADVPRIANDQGVSDRWVATNIKPYGGTKFSSIAVGNEYLADGSLDASKLVPAMRNLQQSLQSAGLTGIKVSTPHAFTVIDPGGAVSTLRWTFQGEITGLMLSMLEFLSQHNSVFMINVYPFFSYREASSDISLDYALLNPNAAPVGDGGSGKQYRSLFDAMVDTVISAMAKLGYPNLPVVITESGWASGPPGEFAATIPNAQSYNNNLVRHVLSSDGTPLRPGAGKIPTFIFALFNENLKDGNPTERNFGLFYPNQAPVYDVQLTSAVVSLKQDGSVIEQSTGVATE